MITFETTNTVLNAENAELTVFFRFSSGDEAAQAFPVTSAVIDIMGWGQMFAERIQASLDAQHAQGTKLQAKVEDDATVIQAQIDVLQGKMENLDVKAEASDVSISSKN